MRLEGHEQGAECERLIPAVRIECTPQRAASATGRTAVDPARRKPAQESEHFDSNRGSEAIRVAAGWSRQRDAYVHNRREVSRQRRSQARAIASASRSQQPAEWRESASSPPQGLYA